MDETRWAGLPTITSVAELEGFGRPDPVPRDKVEDVLDAVHSEWIAVSPMIFVATAGSDGRCDVSPKGDPPGFVKVLDERTLAIPERAGNKRFDGYHNLIGNPHVGLIFIVPGRAETLRVNGAARLVTDGPFFDAMTVRAHRPRLALLVDVEEVFFHCPKALVRSALWHPERWRPDGVRPYAEIARALWRKGEPLEEIAARQTPEAIDRELYPHDPAP